MQANREIIKSRMQANCIVLVKKTQVTRCHAMRDRDRTYTPFQGDAELLTKREKVICQIHLK